MYITAEKFGLEVLGGILSERYPYVHIADALVRFGQPKHYQPNSLIRHSLDLPTYIRPVVGTYYMNVDLSKSLA